MKDRLKQIRRYLAIADLEKDGFIFYCLCMELLDILDGLKQEK